MASVPQRQRNASEYSGFDRQPINGQWRAGKGKGHLVDRNPYTGEVLLEIPQADEQDLDEAHGGALKAQAAWAQMLPAERSAVMREAAQLAEGRHDEIVDVPRRYPQSAEVLKGPWAGG